MAHWPLKLLPPDSCAGTGHRVRVVAGARGPRAVAAETSSARLTLSHDPSHLNNPEAMIAVFAHTLAHYLGTSAEPPEGRRTGRMSRRSWRYS